MQPSKPTPEVRAAAILREYNEHKSLLEAHDKEAKDPKWAKEAERQIGDALGAFASAEGHSAKVGPVDCRTTSCTAPVRWPTRAAALVEASAFVEKTADAKCARRISLPPDDSDKNGPQEATMYLDCSEVRWGIPEPTEPR
jgi:hypothetical protein